MPSSSLSPRTAASIYTLQKQGFGGNVLASFSHFLEEAETNIFQFFSSYFGPEAREPLSSRRAGSQAQRVEGILKRYPEIGKEGSIEPSNGFHGTPENVQSNP